MSHQTPLASPSLIGKSHARARRSTVRIEVDGAVYVGKIYIPDGKRRVSDVLADDRPFLCLTDVSVDGSEILEEFVAINKSYIRTLRVDEEGAPHVMPVRLVQ